MHRNSNSITIPSPASKGTLPLMPGKETGSEMPVPRREVLPPKPEATRPCSSMLVIYGPDTQMQRNDDATGSLPASSSASVYAPGRTGRPTLPLSLSPIPLPLPPPTQVQVLPQLLTRVRSRVPTQVLDLPTHLTYLFSFLLII